MDSWRDIPKWRIGRFGGVPVYLDALYPLMLAAVPFSLLGRSFPSAGEYVLFVVVTILGATLSILLHELGHAAAAKHYGVAADHIRIGPFYGLTFLRGHALKRNADIAGGFRPDAIRWPCRSGRSNYLHGTVHIRSL